MGWMRDCAFLASLELPYSHRERQRGGCESVMWEGAEAMFPLPMLSAWLHAHPCYPQSTL